jgi:DNA-binding IclR family transcriptional regulator
MAERPNDLVQSVSRAFRILEEVGASAAPLAVKAIARRCQLNLSTTYRLVRTLEYEGYLDRQADGCYRLGEGVALRFRDLVSSLCQPPEVHQVLRHVAATTHRSAYLGRFVGGRIMITDLVEGPESPYLEDLEVGLPVAAHATAIGKALLASLSARQRASYLAYQGMRPFTSRTPTQLDDIEEELAGVRPGGVVAEHGQFRDGVSCVAGLVRRDSHADPWWAVVVSVRDEDIPVEVTRSLQLACRDLSRDAVDPGLGRASG